MPAAIDLTPERILAALDAFGGIKAAAAEMLGISPATLRRKMKQQGLDPYIWQPSQIQREKAESEAWIYLAAISGDGKVQRKFLSDVHWGQDNNEPQLLSEAELEFLEEEWGFNKIRKRAWASIRQREARARARARRKR